MAAPQLSVQQQGLGALSADATNTYVQWTNQATDLRAFTGVSGMQVYVGGSAVVDDGGAGMFEYDATLANPVDDGVNVIVPTGSMQGAWIRLALNSNGAIITGPQSILASAAATDLGSANSHLIEITGTTTISSFGTSANTSAPIYFLKFAGALQLTDSGSLLLPGGMNIETAVNDFAIAQYLGTGNWIVLLYSPASGASASIIANTGQTTAGTSTTTAVSPAGLALVEQTGSMIYAADSSGSANTITLALTPAITGYTAGMLVRFLLAQTATGATTVTINGLAAKNVLIGGQAVVSGQLIAGQLYEISYDGTNFEITSLPYPGYAESPTFSIATGTNGSFSTGLTVPPKYAQAFIRCVNPEYGYLTGDEVPIYFHSASGDQFGMVAWISGTSVKYQQGSNGIEVYNTSGGVQSITPSNWLGFVRCWGT